MPFNKPIGSMKNNDSENLISKQFDVEDLMRQGKAQELQQHSANTESNTCKSKWEQHAVLQSSSQRSLSTDDCSSSSSDSSSDSPTNSESSSVDRVPSDLAARGGSFQAKLPNLVSTCFAPIWVENGLKGDAAAWLLVLPKLPQLVEDGGSCSVPVPKSPNDAVLLGPYVSSKNTFLEESRVGGVLGRAQRRRAQSWSPCHSG